MTPEDARLLSKIRGWGDRATNGERRLVAMIDALTEQLADVQRECDATSDEADRHRAERKHAERERDAHREYASGRDRLADDLIQERDALSARLALAEACVPAARRAHVNDSGTTICRADGDDRCTLCAALAAYYAAKCSPETQATGTGSGLSPAAKAGEHLQSPEPAPRMVTLATAKAWCEEMQANCGRMNERVPLPASLLAALEEEATGTVGSASEVGKASSGESEVRPSPEPPAQVCAHPGVMRRSEWLTSSGGVPARIYCQSCGQTLYPPAATPAVPSGIDPVRDVIGDYRCGVDGCTARCASIAVRCYRHSISHEGVGRLKDGPAPKVIFTRQEVDALLAGLRERCEKLAENLVDKRGLQNVQGQIRDAIRSLALWPVTEPERKE